MGRRKKLGGILTALLLLAVAAQAAAAEHFLVKRVVDGDTIIVDKIGRVRLIGVNTPEIPHSGQPGQKGGEDAATFTRKLLTGKEVALEYDSMLHDKFGRTLAYVIMGDGTVVNEELLRRGYAEPILHLPYKMKEKYLKLAAEARRAGVAKSPLVKGTKLPKEH